MTTTEPLTFEDSQFAEFSCEMVETLEGERILCLFMESGGELIDCFTFDDLVCYDLEIMLDVLSEKHLAVGYFMTEYEHRN